MQRMNEIEKTFLFLKNYRRECEAIATLWTSLRYDNKIKKYKKGKQELSYFFIYLYCRYSIIRMPIRNRRFSESESFLYNAKNKKFFRVKQILNFIHPKMPRSIPRTTEHERFTV